MAQRFPHLKPEEMSPAQRAVAAEIAAGPRGEVRGPFIAWLHHPELARRLQSLGEQLRWKAKLPPQLIELAVLICARRWTCTARTRLICWTTAATLPARCCASGWGRIT